MAVLISGRRTLNRLAIIGTFLLFFSVVSLSGCGGSGYKTFEQLKGADHYSFEYRAGYRLTMNHAHSDPRAVNGVRFVGKLSDGSEIVLGVNIGNHAAEYPNAKAAADRTLSVAGRELLERSAGIVSGVSCELITLFTESIPANKLTSKFEKKAIFDYNDRLWDFYVYSERDKAEQVEADFEHLFNTFTLLP
jgi:hypothetical protein